MRSPCFHNVFGGFTFQNILPGWLTLTICHQDGITLLVYFSSLWAIRSKPKEFGGGLPTAEQHVRVLFQARFFIIFHCAGVNRSREAFKHVFLGQRVVGRMQFFEFVKVVENFFGYSINYFIRYFG